MARIPFVTRGACHEAAGFGQLHKGQTIYHVDNDGRPRLRETKPLLVDHPSQLVGDYMNPILNYEGDTLVIDTVGIKADRPVAMLDLYGTRYTKALHVVERLSAA